MPWKDSLLAIVLVTCLVGTGLAIRPRPQRLTVRTSIFDTTPSPAHIRIPLSTCDEGIEEYERVWQKEDSCQPWELYCLCGDPRWCLIFDHSGLLAGAQIGYITKDLPNIPPHVYNFSNPNFKDKIIFNIPVKTVTFLFTNPDELTDIGRNNSCPDIVDGVWGNVNGEWVRLDSKCQPNTPYIGDFAKQGCLPRMGQFFTRGFDEKSTCTHEFFFYLLYENEKLVGFGHALPGLLPPGPGKNVYIHAVDGPLLRATASAPPPCFYHLAPYGFTSVAVWFIDDPWNIRCPKCLCN